MSSKSGGINFLPLFLYFHTRLNYMSGTHYTGLRSFKEPGLFGRGKRLWFFWQIISLDQNK